MGTEITTQTLQPVEPAATVPQDPLIVFFGIGVVLNLILITAYFVWAYKQVKKRGQNDDRTQSD